MNPPSDVTSYLPDDAVLQRLGAWALAPPAQSASAESGPSRPAPMLIPLIGSESGYIPDAAQNLGIPGQNSQHLPSRTFQGVFPTHSHISQTLRRYLQYLESERAVLTDYHCLSRAIALQAADNMTGILTPACPGLPHGPGQMDPPAAPWLSPPKPRARPARDDLLQGEATMSDPAQDPAQQGKQK